MKRVERGKSLEELFMGLSRRRKREGSGNHKRKGEEKLSDQVSFMCKIS